MNHGATSSNLRRAMVGNRAGSGGVSVNNEPMGRDGMRAEVADSWHLSAAAGVDVERVEAPITLAESDLRDHRAAQGCAQAVVPTGAEGQQRCRLFTTDVDGVGLDQMDRRYLSLIALSFGGGPVGVETINPSARWL